MTWEPNNFLLLLDLLICSRRSLAIMSNLVTNPESNLRAINFGEPVVNAALNAGIFSRMRASTKNKCAINCVVAWNCISYNFHATPSDGQETNCELSDEDRFTASASLKSSPGSMHQGIKTNCENTSLCGNNKVYQPNYQDDTVRCVCIHGYHEKPCDWVPKNCKDVFKMGHKVSGVYTIHPDAKEPFDVTCDMTTDGGGWTLLQRRHNKNVHFFQVWNAYKNGFGNLNGNFWLGNDKIRRLTASQEMVLRFDLEDFEGNKTYAVYQNVTVLDESDNYRLYFGEYSGTAGDSFRSHYGQAFTTRDRDNDRHEKDNCAKSYFGGWWYNKCHEVNINGRYLERNSTEIQWVGLAWHNGESYNSRKTTEMKIRPKV